LYYLFIFKWKNKISKLIKINISCGFVGFTDGDGTFHFSKSKQNNRGLYFKIAQSTYNLRDLYYVQKMLGVAQVSISGNKAESRIRDIKSIIQHIIPIFDKYPLLTSKYFNYDLFKQAALIFSNPLLSKEKRTTFNWTLE
jgi:LAGLIDADG endonuclease